MRQDIDGDGLARELFRAYLKQILVDGFFHADPHPGNVLLTDDGRIALLDLGMVSRLTPRDRISCSSCCSPCEADGDRATALALQMGERPDVDEPALCVETSRNLLSTIPTRRWISCRSAA